MAATSLPTESAAGDAVAVRRPTADPEVKRRRTNFFERALLPVTIILTILGMGENNFRHRLLRYAYNLYFVCVIGSVSFPLYRSGLAAVYGAFRAASVSNVIDQYAWWSTEIIWLYNLLTALAFLIWAVKWKKVASMIRLLGEEDFDFLHKLEDDQDLFLQKRMRYLIVKSYIYCFIYVMETLAWPVMLYVVYGVRSDILLDSTNVLPMIIFIMTLAMAFTVYECTAELWTIYNYSLSKESAGARITAHEASDFESIIAKYSDSYDAVSEVTAAVARLFRYFAIVHVVTIVYLITLVYQTLYDPTIRIPMKVYMWFEIALELAPVFAAASVSSSSQRTAKSLRKVYKAYCEPTSDKPSRGAAVTDTDLSMVSEIQIQPSPAYEYFYSRVTNKDMCVSLDIADVMHITNTTLAAMLFAAVNWCAVIMQFRQGSSGSALGGREVMTNGTNATLSG